MSLQEAISICEANGYTVKKKRVPRQHNRGLQTVNPFNHAFPHAKLVNVTLTSITRLAKTQGSLSDHMIENNDPRNYSISGKVPGCA